MEGLVDDCLLKIFSYLELHDLGRLEQVSTRFQELARRSFSVYRDIPFPDGYIRTLSHARTISSKVGPGLRRLKAYGGPIQQQFTLEMLEAFLMNCPNIEHFEFSHIPFQELGMLRLLDNYVSHGEIKIKSVSFDYCYLDDSQDAMFFRHLERATNLEEVHVRYDREFTGKWLKYFKDLKSIDLDDCLSLDPSHFIEFCKRNKTLVNLHLTMTSVDPDFPDFAMNQECVETIAEELKNLQSITISCTDFTDSANLSILADLPKLEKFEIYGLDHLAVPLLKRLAFHNKLQALKCVNAPPGLNDLQEEVDAEIFREMVKIQGLKLFRIDSGFEICDEHLKISTMDQLEELHIPFTAVTNQGLFDFILKNPSLRTLDISFCPKITNKFAQMIIPRLQTDFKSLSIYARGTKMSEESKEILLNEY